MRARLPFIMGVLATGGICRAGPLSIEPWVAVSTDLTSNPYLATTNPQSASDVALLIRAPLRYDEDATHLQLSPSARVSDNGAYSSLTSNYYHLNSLAQFTNELGALSFNANFARDSSLIYNAISSGGFGIRTDSASSGFEWQRALSERLNFDLSGGFSHTTYNQDSVSESALSNRYISLTPLIGYALSERSTLTLSAAVGRYNTLDGISSSHQVNEQLGFTRMLTEIWSLSALAGYSTADDRSKIYFGEYYFGTSRSSQKGPVYQASLARQGESVTFNGALSRAFIPSGYVYLSRQDTISASFTYSYSERWKYTASSSYQKINDALPTGGYASRHNFANQVAASWEWTPVWAISLHLTYVNQSYQVPRTINAQSTGASLIVSRQFYRTDL